MGKIIGFILLFCMISSAYATLHDPTAPPGMSAHKSALANGDFQVKSIIIAPQQKSVIIGTKSYTIGDKVMGAKIIAISEHMITLQGRSGKFTIELFQPINKTPVTTKEQLK
ncbi:MAG: hypothetical protein KAT71_06535 [Gammaproteobacteria bacterium]|nr:hypothetical protein [Gammaproteobacteria bacterium]